MSTAARPVTLLPKREVLSALFGSWDDIDALVMVIPRGAGLPSGADQLLAEYADNLTIVTVTSDGERAFLYELQPQLGSLEMSEHSLAVAVKRAVRRPSTEPHWDR